VRSSIDTNRKDSSQRNSYFDEKVNEFPGSGYVRFIRDSKLVQFPLLSMSPKS
jgi:hypothetical protein